MAGLKTWRAKRAEDLKMDPGVLCPNSALEAIAWRAPQSAKDLRGLPELKGWFQREFGGEVTQVSREVDEATRAAAKEASKSSAKPKP
jgi:ribonuclease D